MSALGWMAAQCVLHAVPPPQIDPALAAYVKAVETHGEGTLLALSKQMGISRKAVYRLHRTAMKNGLVAETRRRMPRAGEATIFVRPIG